MTKWYATDYGKVLARCNVAKANSICTINQVVTVQASIQAGGGLDAGTISGSLGITNTKSKSFSVGCQSPPLPAGSSYKAYAAGYKYKYRVETSNLLGKTYSGWLYAFDPLQNHITCR